MAELATAQHGVVALPQLRALGLSPSAVRSRVAAGGLHRVHRGVYAVGHPLLSLEGRWTAAVLACGPKAVLSHRSAAALWELRTSVRTPTDVTAPRDPRRACGQIHCHRARTLPRTDVTERRGVPCTTVPRTLLDLAETVDRRSLERACDQAEVLRLLDVRAVRDLLDRAHGRRGVPLLRTVLGKYDIGEGLTRSELEERFLAICARTRVPRPQVNAWLTVGGHAMQIDFLWSPQRLVVETDGYRFHSSRRAFESDRRRDQSLALAGWTVLRFTWRQVARDPHDVSDVLERLFSEAARVPGVRR